MILGRLPTEEERWKSYVVQLEMEREMNDAAIRSQQIVALESAKEARAKEVRRKSAPWFMRDQRVIEVYDSLQRAMGHRERTPYFDRTKFMEFIADVIYNPNCREQHGLSPL